MLVILIIILFGALLLIRSWWQHHWQNGLITTVAFSSKRIFQGEKLTLTQHIYNNKRLPLNFVQVILPVPRAFRLVVDQGDGVYMGNLNQIYSLKGYENKQRTLKVQMARRGVFRLAEIELEGRDLFSAKRYAQKYPIEQEIIVYPRWLDLARVEQHWQSSLGETLTRFSLFEDPLLFRGVRELQPQDSLKQVNWKKTATTGTFYVNQYEPVAQRQLTIVLELPDDPSWRTEKYGEATISLFATIAHECLAAGWQLKILSNACDEQGDPFAMAHLGSMDVLLDTCAAIELEKTTSSADLFAEIMNGHEEHIIVCSSAIARHVPFQAQLGKAMAENALWINMVDHLHQEVAPVDLEVKEVLLA